MRILFVMPYMKYSGAPRMMATVANWYAREHDVSICIFYTSEVGQIIDDSISINNLNIKRYNNKILNFCLSYPATLRKAFQYIKQGNFDAIVSFGDIFSLLLIKKIKKMNKKVIISERADPTGLSWFSKWRRKQFGYADRIVFQTNCACDCFDKEVLDKSVVIPNPVLITKESIVSYKERLNKIVCVGRFDFTQKCQNELIIAFKSFSMKNPEYTLEFYGDGVDLIEAKRMVSLEKLDEKVVFHGVVTPIEHYISDAMMLVSASSFEGIPNAIIEAMNMCIPVVSTDCSPGGARMLLENGKNGEIVPCHNPYELSEAMDKVVKNKDLYFEKATTAKKSLSRFDEAVISKLWLEQLKIM